LSKIFLLFTYKLEQRLKEDSDFYRLGDMAVHAAYQPLDASRYGRGDQNAYADQQHGNGGDNAQ